MADLQTCCPHCSTTFQITDSQIQSANGLVRCGSCLLIFTALENLTDEQSLDDSAEPLDALNDPLEDHDELTDQADLNANTIEPFNDDLFEQVFNEGPPDELSEADLSALNFDTSDTETAPLSDTDDNQLISDDMDQQSSKNTGNFGDLTESFQRDHQIQQASSSLFEREINPQENIDIDNVDESWALDLLEEFDNNELEGAFSEEETLLNDDDLNPPTEESADGTTYIDLPALDLGAGEDMISKPNSKLSQPHEEHHQDDKDYSLSNTGTFERVTEEQLDTHLGEPFETTTEPLHTNELEDAMDDDGYHIDDTNRDDALRNSVVDLLGGIGAAPVEMEAPEPRSTWPRKLIWASLCVLAGATLLAQAGYFKYDELSRQQPYRAWYTKLCPAFGCILPAMNEPRLVKAYNLVVRSHPQQSNALVIDSILLNTATFQQAFPDLILSFSDIENNTVAQRRFTPAEYLGGELAGITTMPSAQPIHVALEITDPGAEAVNYRMDIALQ